MKGYKALLVGVATVVVGVSSAYANNACVADNKVKIKFDSDKFDVIMQIDDVLTSKKKSVYYIKDDFDGSAKLLAIGLSAKDASNTELQALKKSLREALLKFKLYWQDAKIENISEDTKKAIEKAEKLHADLGEEKLTKEKIKEVLDDIVKKVDKEKSGKIRSTAIMKFDEKGKKEVVKTETEELGKQFPKGFLDSALEKEKDIIDADDAVEGSPMCKDAFTAEVLPEKPRRQVDPEKPTIGGMRPVEKPDNSGRGRRASSGQETVEEINESNQTTEVEESSGVE